jgi:acetyltransferase-like isoleucine patch superfamily enzyme
MTNLFEKTVNLLRGFIYKTRFDKSGLVQITGKIKIIKKFGRIEIGHCKIWKGAKLSVCGKKDKIATLSIGDNSAIGDRTEIHVGERVTIGERVLISSDCMIMDRDYHGIGTKPERILPVTIEDGAWICCRAIILPGVKIGKGSIIGAGAVVTHNIPPFQMAAGNPARVIRSLER